MEAEDAFFVMEESGLNELQNAYVIGWNSTWLAAKQSTR